MKEEKLLRIHRIYSIVLSIVITIAGICFMVACGCIYFSGGEREQIYTLDIISQAFDTIAIPVYLCLTMVILSFVLEILSPLQFKKGMPGKPYAWILKRLQIVKDFSALEPELQSSILTLRGTRKRFITIRSILLTVGSLAFLFYALNGAHFDSTDINGSMIKAMVILCACLLIPFAFSIATSYHCRKSMQQEIELLKKAPSSGNELDTSNSVIDSKMHVIQTVLLIVALGFLFSGLLTGGTADVLTKAINICTECIGLG